MLFGPGTRQSVLLNKPRCEGWYLAAKVHEQSQLGMGKEGVLWGGNTTTWVRPRKTLHFPGNLILLVSKISIKEHTA